MELHHLAVVVSDLPRAEAFWVDVLGLRVVRRWDDGEGRHRSTWVDLGGVFLALERAAAEGPKRVDGAPGFHCLALSIAPELRDTWGARLAAAGHPLERETDFTFYVRDPDGNLVGFSHFPHPRAT